jgi:hypothetical protein
MITEATWTLRQQILRKYGGHCTCPCGCVDANLRHLQLDHRAGGGNAVRKTLRGERWYAKLLSLPVDPLIRPLCANCHWETTLFAECTGVTELSRARGVTEIGKTPALARVEPEVPVDQIQATDDRIIPVRRRWWQR